MSNSGNNFDPYAAPTSAPALPYNTPTELSFEQKKLLKDFRSQSLALGVLWLIFAVVIFAAIVMLLVLGGPLDTRMTILIVTALVQGVAYVAAGVATLLKKPWGLYVGLVNAYLAVVSNLLGLNICALVISIVIIVQGHRVIGFIKQLNGQGIPLDTKPEPFTPQKRDNKPDVSGLFDG